LISLVGVPLIAGAVSKDGGPTIAVVNYPLKYFAERIAGDQIEVVFPIPADVDPAFWIPEPEGVLTFQAADLIFLNGATYSKWLNTVSLPRRKLVNTSQSFEEQYIRVKDPTSHTHGPTGTHAHVGFAFTTWIDFKQAIQQAEAIRNALVGLVPEKKQQFDVNFSALEAELLALDGRIDEIVAKKRTQALIASHPIYDYFARRYGLNIRSVLWEPDELPTATQWSELEAILKQHRARWMIWESQPRSDSVRRLRAMGVSSFVFDPVTNVPRSGDFMAVMQRNIENLEGAFR
jgi:zinc transport system substrate-binding protein